MMDQRRKHDVNKVEIWKFDKPWANHFHHLMYPDSNGGNYNKQKLKKLWKK